MFQNTPSVRLSCYIHCSIHATKHLVETTKIQSAELVVNKNDQMSVQCLMIPFFFNSQRTKSEFDQTGVSLYKIKPGNANIF